MNRLPAALDAVQRGWWTFPCNPGEKTPHLVQSGKPWQIRWGEVATNDLNKIIEWWAYSPDANVGIPAKPSGLLVVDCDRPKTPNVLKDTPWAYLHDQFGPWDIDGGDLFHELCGRYGDDWARLTATYTVCTPRLGVHYYYAWPEGVQASQASIADGLLDVRGNGGMKGGYVLGAGSATADGTYAVERDAPVAMAPPWLVELVREKPALRPKRPEGFRAPGPASYGGLVEAVRFAYDGNRNNCLLWAARSMCEDGADLDEALRLLIPAALECGLDGGERQARSTIQSAYRLQQAKGH